MVDILKAIIFDEKKDEHLELYKEVCTAKYTKHAEKNFDLVIDNGSGDIYNIISDNKNFDCIITIGDENAKYYKELYDFDYSVRKKWVNLENFNPQRIAESIINVFCGNINRERPIGNKLFSFFTCTFNTKEYELKRLYESMKRQIYKEWNWYILDDSTTNLVSDFILSLHDYRITLIKNVTDHGSIGFNKRTIAMMCDGDYLVEVDHDDELTDDCLYFLKMAFEKFPESVFVYSNVLELVDGKPCVYEDGWGWGEGKTKKELINGVEVEFSFTPEINPFSIRTIYAQPNHVRCWEKSFYHKIDGHNVMLGVMDDMDLIIRTFLNGKMTKVEKVLYIQHEKSNRVNGGGTTQSKRFGEIQRICYLLKKKYDKDIHERIVELGYFDYAWDDMQQCSILWKNHKPGMEIMSNLFIV